MDVENGRNTKRRDFKSYSGTILDEILHCCCVPRFRQDTQPVRQQVTQIEAKERIAGPAVTDTDKRLGIQVGREITS